jgi:folate-binding protein YgfZ
MTGPEATEVEALRRGAACFSRGRDVFAVRGPDAEAYLQGQLSQDVVVLAVGASADSLLLHPDGKLVALLRITRTASDSYVLDTDAGFGDLAVARLRKFLLRSKVEMEHLDWRCMAVRGAATADAVAGLTGDVVAAGGLVVDFSWNGWTGVDLLGPRDAVPEAAALVARADGAGLRAVGGAAAEAVRIASGVPAMGSELTDKTIAAEAGLVAQTVSFTKGCYTGQELVARLDARGSNVARRLVGITAAGDSSYPALAPGMTLHAGEEDPAMEAAADKVVGTVTSAAWSPELEAWAGLGYLHRSVAAPGPVRVRSGDGLGAARPAQVAPLPLVGGGGGVTGETGDTES